MFFTPSTIHILINANIFLLSFHTKHIITLLSRIKQHACTFALSKFQTSRLFAIINETINIALNKECNNKTKNILKYKLSVGCVLNFNVFKHYAGRQEFGIWKIYTHSDLHFRFFFVLPKI